MSCFIMKKYFNISKVLVNIFRANVLVCLVFSKNLFVKGLNSLFL